jgi:membrane-associated protease RseP (regulator of RpoE activity)
MSGPKHLWSGDWQNESEAASDELADRRRTPREQEPAASPAPPARARPHFSRPRVSIPPRPRLPRPLLIGTAAALLVAAGAYGLIALLGASGSGSATTAGSTATVASGYSRPVNWLGMEIETVPSGSAVIDTVRLGSPGDRAGLEPGDVILQINNRPVSGAGDIAAAIRGLHSGDRVEIQISQGSALFETQATLAAPPSAYP